MDVQGPELRSTHTKQHSLQGRRAVVSGGTSGIARAVAALLAAEGAEVLVLGESPEDMNQTLAPLPSVPGRIVGVVVDPFEPSAVERAFATADREFGGIDVLVNVAGSYAEAPADAWRYRLHADLDGFIDCTQHALKRMRHGEQGHIVNVASVSPLAHAGSRALFASARASLRDYTLALRRELSGSGIKVSLIEPDTVGTWSFPMQATPEPPAGERRLEQVGEMLKPQDIAVAVHFCLTQPARCVVSHIQLAPLNES